MPSISWTSRTQRRRLKNLIAATATLALTSAAGQALADSGGGMTVTAEPKVRDVLCSKECAGLRSATKGSLITVTGKALSEVKTVSFKSEGAGARVSVKARSTSASAVTAVVPRGAKSGSVKVTDELGRSAVSEQELKIVAASQVEEAGAFKLLEATASPKKTYVGGARRTKLTYMFRADGPTDIRIDVSKRASGKIVRSLTVKGAKPSSPHTIVWDGHNNGGARASNGRYTFRVGPVRSPQTLSAGGAGSGDAAFSMYDHKFPVRGRHTYGDGLGAGRNHNGQDIFAKCGTPMQAARAGRVQFRAFHSAAGYYVVIDGAGNNLDYVYMHLAKPSPLRKGQRVKTGQYIGDVGDTGNASGCHLHFELWKGDWYNGGRVVDPTAPLKAWDRWS